MIADRISRRTLLIITQSAMMLLAGSLAVYISEPGTVMVSALVLLGFAGLVLMQLPALRKLA